jgi:nucleoside-diphosphate-sugar epimerase
VPRVLVTGAGGALGRHLVALLRDPDVVTWGSRRDVDLRDRQAVDAALHVAAPDVVFHLAGTRADAVEATNSGGFDNLAAALLRHAPGARVVIAGSSAQYGLRDDVRPIREDDEQRPEGAYGESKAKQEAHAFASGLDVVAVRLFNLVGALQRPGVLPADLTAQLADPATDRLVVRHRVGTRDFVDHADAARALVALAQHGEANTAYNVASGRATTLAELTDALLELSGRSLPVDDLGAVPDDTARVHQVGDASRLRALGWTPLVDLRESLAAQLAAAS